VVPHELNRKTVLTALIVGAAALWAVPGEALPLRDPGPFYPLVVGHAGEAYSDRLPSGASYALRSGSLPSGVTVSTSGRVSGTPRETGTFAATFDALEANGARYPVRLAMTVRRADESDVPRTVNNFFRAGPYTPRTDTLTVDLLNTFDDVVVRTTVRIVRPLGHSGPAPLLMFHRGRGFDEDSYTLFHDRIASHGIAVASVEDRYSFAGATFSAQNPQYDRWRAELGMESASGVVEAVSDYLLDRSGSSQDPLGGSFDRDNLFFAGHSRGGGAVHASHQRSWNLRLKGLIYLMAFDLKFFAELEAPTRPPAYPIFAENPRTPSLIIVAENDGDLVYPIADQLIDRATGPTTQVTLYGGVHNFISDTHPSESDERISRYAERTRVANWIVTFVKRWSTQDTGLDWRLYGGGHQGSTAVGVTSWRPSARTLVLEDAQDANPDRNLRGANYVSRMRRGEDSIYPPVGDLDSLRLRHTILTPTATVSAWRMASDAAMNLSTHQRVVMRISQTGSYGWSGLGLWLRMIDGQGGASWFRVHEPTADGGLLPEYSGLSPNDRFVDVHVDLDDFFASSGSQGVDRNAVRALDLFVVVRDANRARSVVTDVIRFE
jgi:hypothetical protein